MIERRIQFEAIEKWGDKSQLLFVERNYKFYGLNLEEGSNLPITNNSIRILTVSCIIKTVQKH